MAKKNNKKTKPTNQDFVNVINKMLQDLFSLQNRQNAVEGALDLYIELNGDAKKFKEFIDSKLNIQQKEDDELSKVRQDNKVADKADITD